MAIRIQIMRILSVDSKKFPLPGTSLTKKVARGGNLLCLFTGNYLIILSSNPYIQEPI